MDTSGKALVAFWKMAGNKGLVNQNTAGAKRAACSQIMGVLDDWETIDVSSLDVEDVFRRFTHKRGADFTPASLGTYKSRLVQAVTEFLAYTKNPAGWRPNAPERAPATRAAKPAAATPQKENGNEEAHPDSLPNRTGLVEYPFPLREGRFAYLRLPVDLKMADVKRLTAYLGALADDGEAAT